MNRLSLSISCMENYNIKNIIILILVKHFHLFHIETHVQKYVYNCMVLVHVMYV